MNKLDECAEEAGPAIKALREKYDIRVVLAVLGAQLAASAAAALAGGVERRFVAEIIAGTIDSAYAPLAVKPVVYYIDDDQVLGRKQ